MAYSWLAPLSGDRYINPLTDFGFKRIFGTEPNKVLLIDFLNVILPARHHVKDLTYRSTEQLGNTPIDRKAVFDLYCESECGEKFIVEMQKAKHNYFKDRSVYYATFPIQEQAQLGNWNYKLEPVYTIGILDFIFDDHKNDPSFLHIIDLKDQECHIFYEKLKFIYLELPKFTKPLEQLTNHFEKWLYLLKHLPDLPEPPHPLQESVFLQLFEIAEIAKFSREERDAYENSLKHYRDLQGVIDTAREEGLDKGFQQGFERGQQQGFQQGQRFLLIRMLERKLGQLSEDILDQINCLSSEKVAALEERLFEFSLLADLENWLAEADPNH